MSFKLCVSQAAPNWKWRQRILMQVSTLSFIRSMMPGRCSVPQQSAQLFIDGFPCRGAPPTGAEKASINCFHLCRWVLEDINFLFMTSQFFQLWGTLLPDQWNLLRIRFFNLFKPWQNLYNTNSPWVPPPLHLASSCNSTNPNPNLKPLLINSTSFLGGGRGVYVWERQRNVKFEAFHFSEKSIWILNIKH